MQYEGYGPGGTAVLIECAGQECGDFAAQLRPVFAAFGGHLGAAGSVSYLFARTGVLTYAASSAAAAADLDAGMHTRGWVAARLTEAALAAGAEDVLTGNGGIEILTDPEDFAKVRAALQAAGFVAIRGQITQRPASTVTLNREDADTLSCLVERLKSLQAVRDVYTNAQAP